MFDLKNATASDVEDWMFSLYDPSYFDNEVAGPFGWGETVILPIVVAEEGSNDETGILLNDWDNWTELLDSSEDTELPDGVTLSAVASYGGEGQGDQYWFVFSLRQAGVEKFYKIDGYYQSFEGGWLDGPLFEVQPVKREVTFYE